MTGRCLICDCLQNSNSLLFFPSSLRFIMSNPASLLETVTSMHPRALKYVLSAALGPESPLSKVDLISPLTGGVDNLGDESFSRLLRLL